MAVIGHYSYESNHSGSLSTERNKRRYEPARNGQSNGESNGKTMRWYMLILDIANAHPDTIPSSNLENIYGDAAQFIPEQLRKHSMLIQVVKNCFLKLLGRGVLIPHPVNTIIGIHSVDGIFCLVADRRIYDDLGQVVEAVYDADTNTCQPIVKAAEYPPKDLIRYHLTDGSTLTVCPSLDLSIRVRRLP